MLKRKHSHKKCHLKFRYSKALSLIISSYIISYLFFWLPHLESLQNPGVSGHRSTTIPRSLDEPRTLAVAASTKFTKTYAKLFNLFAEFLGETAPGMDQEWTMDQLPPFKTTKNQRFFGNPPKKIEMVQFFTI